MRFTTLLALAMTPLASGNPAGDPLQPRPGLVVEHLGSTYQPDPATLRPGLFYHPPGVVGGNTSLRNTDRASLVWKSGTGRDPNGSGYYQRNRDLGQVFNLPAGASATIRALVLRTGQGDNAVMAGTPGAELFLQVFEVAGTPVIDDNGTPFGTRAAHGWDTSHAKADDFLRGVTYTPLALFAGGRVPESLRPTTRRGPGEPGHLQYLRLRLPEDAPLRLEAGDAPRRFAVVVGFVEPAPSRGLGLANTWSMENAPPGTPLALRSDANGLAWWGVRREGDGTLPPTMLGDGSPVDEPAPGDAVRARLQRESLFAEGRARYALQPTTRGFPDVCTYRTYEFTLEVEP